MSGLGSSLLPFLPAPVAVVDPDGKAVYVNPAFADAFDTSESDARGRPLAEIFAGGAREVVLGATDRVCREGRTVRFRLREGEHAYAASAAPIEAEGANVGLVFLFFEEPAGERVLSYCREIQEPLLDLAHALDSMLEQTGGRRSERFRTQVEIGLRAAERLRKWSDELSDAVAQRPDRSGESAADALAVAHEVGEAASRTARVAGHELELMLPAALPTVRGDAGRLADALVRFARERLEAAPEGSRFTWTVKALKAGVLFSFTEVPPDDAKSFALQDEAPPAALAALVEPLGGSLVRVADPVAGVTTAIRLPLAA
jgi:nitrogen-specific signal transduction histidine kinase